MCSSKMIIDLSIEVFLIYSYSHKQLYMVYCSHVCHCTEAQNEGGPPLASQNGLAPPLANSAPPQKSLKMLLLGAIYIVYSV